MTRTQICGIAVVRGVAFTGVMLGSLGVHGSDRLGCRRQGLCFGHARSKEFRRCNKQSRQPDTGQHVSARETHAVIVPAA